MQTLAYNPNYCFSTLKQFIAVTMAVLGNESHANGNPLMVIRGVMRFYAPFKAPAVKIQGFPESLSFHLRNPPYISIFLGVEKSLKTHQCTLKV